MAHFWWMAKMETGRLLSGFVDALRHPGITREPKIAHPPSTTLSDAGGRWRMRDWWRN